MDKSKRRKCLEKCHHKDKRCFINIGKNDFRKSHHSCNLTETYVIDKPGVYRLCEDVGFSPVSDPDSLQPSVVHYNIDHLKQISDQIKNNGFTAGLSLKLFGNSNASRDIKPKVQITDKYAILIKSSNVVLNLGNHRLYQANDTKGVIGIKLAEGYENITIMNGILERFTGAAIHSHINDDNELNNLIFKDLIITNNGGIGNPQPGIKIATGIVLASDSTLDVMDSNAVSRYIYNGVQIRNCIINKNTNVGVWLTQAADVVIQNTSLDETYLKDGTYGFVPIVAGIVAQSCENVRLIDVTVNFTRSESRVLSYGTIVVVIAGALFISTSNVVVSRCQFNDTTGEAIVVAGFLADVIPYSLFEDTQFNSTSGSGILTLLVNGFHVSDTFWDGFSSEGLKFVNCQFNDQRISNDTTGLFFDTVSVGGVVVVTSKDVTFDGCQIHGVMNKNSEVDSTLYGMLISSFPEESDSMITRNVTLRKCDIGDIINVRRSHGILLAASVFGDYGSTGTMANIVIDENIISNIVSSSDDPLEVSAGIFALQNLDASFLNCQIKRCRIVEVKRVPEIPKDHGTAGISLLGVLRPNIESNSISNCTNGILLAGSDDGTIMKNKVDNCSNGGYLDLNTVTTCVWMKNYAFKCGTPPDHPYNYTITFGVISPIQTGELSVAYPSGSQTWYNVSIIP